MRFPDFYAPSKVGQLYLPQSASAFTQGISEGFKPAADDQRQVMLLLVDPQVDFVHTDGALAVPGAVADTRRTIEWIFRNTEKLSAIAVSLDSHIPRQIFYASWWADSAGKHPEPFTAITTEDVTAGRWHPLFEQEWSINYVRQLESAAKKALMIWPFHTMMGTPGHAITPALFEALAYHSGARNTQPTFLHKGSVPKTEHYSILEPEVKMPGIAGGELNVDFLNMLAGCDEIYVAGQAKSHCVLETVSTYMRHFANEPAILRKMHLLMDCTSSVVHPEIDFDSAANAAFAEFEAQGLRIVQSAYDV